MRLNSLYSSTSLSHRHLELELAMALSVFHGEMPYTSIAVQPSASSILLRGMHVTPSSKASCILRPQRKTHIITITATMPIELGASVARTVEEKEFHMPRPPLHARASHSMSAEKVELFKSLDGWMETNILPIMTSVEKSWQPQDFLPEPSSDGFCNELQELKARSLELPDDYLVCLVGDMITEEALPATYQSILNRAAGVSDEIGARLTAWARWTRAWTAEENRHGDLLNKYLYLTGRVDMRAIEKTIQYLVGRGMDPQTGNSPYLATIYTSFQERATFVSHGNTARQAKQFGDTKLAQICGAIAVDERRHEKAYTRIVEKLFEVDPDCTMLALEEMMRKKIGMPARLMYDGHSKHIFDEFCGVAQKTGVYTVKDNADILEHLMKRWNVEKLEGLSSRGQEAQEYVCNLANCIRRVGDIAWKVKREPKSVTFSWIFNREVALH